MSESGNPTIAPGTILADRYEIQDPIGHGGFGTVYRARQLNIDRDIAVKVLPPKFLTSTEVVERFRREAQLASRLRHPHTITIHDYGRHEDYLFIAMELLEGEDLADALHRDTRLPLEKIVHVATQVLKSLAEAHDRGIVHRDLKPENIFLSVVGNEQDFIKVLDFGIAKFKVPTNPEPADDNLSDTNPFRKSRQLTMSGSTVGTPIYMSPEQAAGEDVDALSDIYALGIIMYEMAQGHPPFYGENPVKIMRSHLFDAVPHFTHPELRDAPLENIILKALQKDKTRRFQNAGEFLAALTLEIDLTPTRHKTHTPSSEIPTPETPENKYIDEPPTLEMFASAYDSEPFLSAPTTAHLTTPDFTPLPSDALRTTDPDLVFNELDSVPFIQALDNPREPVHQRAAHQPSSTSSILTILDAPTHEAQEVLLLTRPKSIQPTPNPHPIHDPNTGNFQRLRETPPSIANPITEPTTPAPAPTPQPWDWHDLPSDPSPSPSSTTPSPTKPLLLIAAIITLLLIIAAATFFLLP